MTVVCGSLQLATWFDAVGHQHSKGCQLACQRINIIAR